MARKRTNHGTDVDAQIRKMTDRGWTAEHIAKVLQGKGVDVSRATIGRRQRELRGKVRVGRPTTKAKDPSSKKRARSSEQPADLEDATPQPTTPPPEQSDPELPQSVDDIPEGLSLDMLHRLRAKADRAASAALNAKELATFAAMGRLVTALSEAIRKATPPEKPNPEDSPDMLAAAKRARELLHRLIDQVVGQ